MKKTITIILTLALVLTLLAACGNGSLSSPKNGTYKAPLQTWTFSGKDEITVSTLGGFISSDGTYSVSGTTLTMTTSLLGQSTTTSYKITEITSKSFFIDGEKFVKQ